MKVLIIHVISVIISQQANLIRHTQSIHDDKWYPCDKCEKFYNDISALTYHTKIKHDGSGKHCELCGKQ